MKKRLLIFGVAGLVVLLVASVCLAEIEFSVGGHFRALSYYVANPDLVKGGPERSYTEQMLILNPVLKLSDWIQVKTRLRALDYIWGDNGVPGLTWGPMIRTGQGSANDMTFQWDRAWVHLFFGKYGSLQIGRQQTDLFHNFSIAEDDTYPRYHYITPVFSLPNENNIMFGILYDKRGEGDLDKANDDHFAWCPWFFFWNPTITIGYVFFVWDCANMGPAGESSNWIMHDAMINAKIGPVDIKSEIDYLMGREILGYRKLKHTLEFFVDASIPIEASPYLDRASVVVGLFSGTTDADPLLYNSGSIGSNEDWVDEWKIDMILWDQIYNQIRNAWIIRPKIDFVVPDTKWGGFVSACMSFADQQATYQDGFAAYDPVPRLVGPGPDGIVGTADDVIASDRAPNGAVLTGGTEKSIGTEIDLGINYTLGPRQTVELVAGILMPGKYFAEANRDTTIGMALKTHIRF